MSLVLASVVESLVSLAQPWKDIYDDSTPLSTGVVAVHLLAMLIGGGLALSMDRATLRVTNGSPADRQRHLTELGATHRTVVGALVISLISGAALFLSDVETFATSKAYWAKMTFVVLLLINGFAMTRTEAKLARTSSSDVTDGALWQRLRTSSIASAALWMITLVAGVILTSV